MFLQRILKTSFSIRRWVFALMQKARGMDYSPAGGKVPQGANAPASPLAMSLSASVTKTVRTTSLRIRRKAKVHCHRATNPSHHWSTEVFPNEMPMLNQKPKNCRKGAVETRTQGTVTSTVSRGCRVGAPAPNAIAPMAPRTARAASFTVSPPVCPVKSLSARDPAASTSVSASP